MATAWAAPGIGTAIRDAALIRKAKPTATRFQRTPSGVGLEGHYSGQPENERYLNYVADKFDLRRDIQLIRTSLPRFTTSAPTDGTPLRATTHARAVSRRRSRNFSSRYTPPFEGVDSFKGESFHTSRWPKEKVDFTGKRVAVIGTGATAVQMIPIIAKSRPSPRSSSARELLRTLRIARR